LKLIYGFNQEPRTSSNKGLIWDKKIGNKTVFCYNLFHFGKCQNA